MSTSEQQAKRRRLCFVTIGATAAFDSLIKATLSPAFLQSLSASGYTDLLLQYGRSGRLILENFRRSSDAQSEEDSGINITGFDFNMDGLGSEMRAAKGDGDSVEGVVISHAGISPCTCYNASDRTHCSFRFWFDPCCHEDLSPHHCGA